MLALSHLLSYLFVLFFLLLFSVMFIYFWFCGGSFSGQYFSLLALSWFVRTNSVKWVTFFLQDKTFFTSLKASHKLLHQANIECTILEWVSYCVRQVDDKYKRPNQRIHHCFFLKPLAAKNQLVFSFLWSYPGDVFCLHL